MPQDLLGLDVDRVYSVLGGVGLNYQGLFRGMVEACRSLGYATASGVWSAADLGGDYAVHPALLDVAFQTMFLARAHHSSGQITSALLPVRIKRVTINPLRHHVRRRTRYRPAEEQGCSGTTKCMFDAFEALIQNIRENQHPLLRKEWLSDNYSVVEELCSKYPGQIDLQLTQAVGQNLGAVVRGEMQQLEVMLKDDMLNRFYIEGCGFPRHERERQIRCAANHVRVSQVQHAGNRSRYRRHGKIPGFPSLALG